jgi:hypothetical protein
VSPIRHALHTLETLSGAVAAPDAPTSLPAPTDQGPVSVSPVHDARPVAARLRTRVAAGAVSALGVVALLGASCGSLERFSPPSVGGLAREPHVLHAPLAPGVTLSAPVPLPVESPAEPVPAEPQPEPAPEEPLVAEVAMPGPGGTPYAPGVERWRGPVRELIAEARAEGRLTGAASVIDEDLVLAVIQQESGGDPDAMSWAGARGLMQLMPESFAWIMLGRRWGSSLADVDPNFAFDPYTNLRAGIRFLGAVLEEQGGSIYWALASYNAGGGAVNSWRAAGHTAVPAYGGYWETAAYAPAILSNYEAHRTQG